MAVQPDDVYVPEEVSKAAEMALELHGKLFPTETPVDDPKPADAAHVVVEDQAPVVTDPPVVQDDEDWKHKYEVLQGKYSKEVPRLAQRVKELEQHRTEPAVPPKTEPIPPANAQADEIIAKLKEEYPEELIENLLLLQRLQSEQVVTERVKPIQDKVTLNEDAQFQARQDQHLNLLNEKAPAWQTIWSVASELEAGVEPSDDRIAEFLNRPDPSGLYTNLELLNMYSDRWDAERFATVCNMYTPQAAPRPNPAKEALLAPSRTNNQPVPNADDKKIWTMAEIDQFQRDRRSDRISDADADLIWKDIQQALAENRIR